MEILGKLRTGMARGCALLLVAILLLSLVPAGEVQAADASESGKLNVMLVIDGSGSLTGTDPDGYRYDAIDLFLAMLTNSGNEVGAIVFDEDIMLNIGIARITGKSGKMGLSEQIRNAGTDGDTDIGGALLAGVQEAVNANQRNENKSVVILFSDGRTDVPGAEEKSLEDKESAIKLAQDNDVPVHSVCLNASSTASPEELEEISERTSGEFESVSNAEGLSDVFKTFYNLIFPDSSNAVPVEKFPESGVVEFDILVPNYGAEEVNVIFDTTGLQESIFTSPSGILEGQALSDSTMSGGPYDVVKLVEPQAGNWHIKMTGTPGAELTANILYNIDSSVTLKTQDGQTVYKKGDSVTFLANLVTQGNDVTATTVTQDYTAELTLKNLANNAVQTQDMTADVNGVFTYTHAIQEKGSWSAVARFTCGDLVIESEELVLSCDNTAPVASQDKKDVEITLTPFGGKSYSLNVSDYFEDKDTGDVLKYELVSSQLVDGTVSVDEVSGKLTVNTEKSRSGKVVIAVTDSYGASAQMTVHMKVTDLTWLFYVIIIAVLAGILVIILSAVLIAKNRPWKGMLSVTSLSSGVERTRGSFRGKLTLTKLGIRSCGLEGAFVATGNNRMEFRSKNPVYTDYQKNIKKVSLANGFNNIYADEAHTQGIEVQLQPKM